MTQACYSCVIASQADIMAPPAPTQDSRIVKKLLPHAPGTKRLTERFGNALVCVRYRIDAGTQRRYTTVELVVAESALPPSATADVFVRIGYGELKLREQVKNAGGQWHPDRKLWRLPRLQARALGLLKRIPKPTQQPA